MKTNQRTIEWFRKTAIAEGLSFLILLLVAMPLKYFAGLPQAVTFFWLGAWYFICCFSSLVFRNHEDIEQKFSLVH